MLRFQILPSYAAESPILDDAGGGAAAAGEQEDIPSLLIHGVFLGPKLRESLRAAFILLGYMNSHAEECARMLA